MRSLLQLPHGGVYTLHGASKIWRQLGLGDPPNDRPIYVGKSKQLVTRPFGQHFDLVPRKRMRQTSLTGSSSPRRSFAALLRARLDLTACPRNLRKPGYFDKFGLVGSGDGTLTRWIRDNIQISFYETKQVTTLRDLEREICGKKMPPFNLDIETPWQDMICYARKRMTLEAEAWTARSRSRTSRLA